MERFPNQTETSPPMLKLLVKALSCERSLCQRSFGRIIIAASKNIYSLFDQSVKCDIVQKVRVVECTEHKIQAADITSCSLIYLSYMTVT